MILTKPAVSVFDTGFENAWKYITEETDKILIREKCCTCRYIEESIRIMEQLKESML